MSAVIVEEQIEASQQGVRHEQLAWHGVLPRLAVSSYSDAIGGDVNFFTHEVGKAQASSFYLIFLYRLT
jgi:hypothetical protein